jgi:hypothetical protein
VPEAILAGLAGPMLIFRKITALRDNDLEGRQLIPHGRAALNLIKVNLGPLKIRTEFGTKMALIKAKEETEVLMLWTILVILFILWALGFFAFHAGGLIHVLLVIAVIVLIVRLLQGRRIL